MLETIKEMASFSFINRAIIVGVLVSLCAALLGVILVLKRYSMIGDRTITCRIWNIDSISSFWMGTTSGYNSWCNNFCNTFIKDREQ